MDEKIENSIVALNSKNASRLNVGTVLVHYSKQNLISLLCIHQSYGGWLCGVREVGGQFRLSRNRKKSETQETHGASVR